MMSDRNGAVDFQSPFYRIGYRQLSLTSFTSQILRRKRIKRHGKKTEEGNSQWDYLAF